MNVEHSTDARILVTDAGRGSAVATIRSLARHGFEVIAADSDRRSPGLASRYAKHRIVYACPRANPKQFIRDIVAAVDQHQVDLLIPVTELVILPLEAVREQIERVCKVTWPPAESVGTVRDKDLTFRLAEKLKIPFPRTRLVHNVDEALRIAPGLGWPLVLKPSSSHTVTDDSAIQSWTVEYAHDELELREKMQQFEGRCPVLLQEYFAGAGVGVEVLAHAGEPICAFQHRRLREVPLTGGVSSLRRSDPLDPLLYAHTLALIKALNWTGLAMAEFKLNERGESRLMEINGRIWGSLPVAISAGVNFPVALCELYLNGPPDKSVPVQTAYRTGVHVHNFHKELSWIYRVLRGSPQHAVMKLPKRRAAFRAVFDLLNPRYRFDILSLTDPMPGVQLVSNLTRSAWKSWRRVFGPRPNQTTITIQPYHQASRTSGLVRLILSFHSTCQVTPRMRANQEMLKILRQTAFQAANTTAFGSVLRMLEKVNSAKQGVLAVVTYHRIDHAARTPNLYPGLISATPEQFCKQLDILSKISQVVSLPQVLDARRRKTELPAKSVLITFDDACRDFADYAWPALRDRGMPATVFVPTAYPDQPQRRFWWDRLYVAIWHGNSTHIDTAEGTFVLESDEQRRRVFRRLKDHVKQLQHDSAMQFVEDICEQQQAPSPPRNVLSWDQLRNLAGQGVTLAPHTQTHPLLTRITIDQARQEVVGSRADLNREIGDVLPVFAYPGGACNPPVTDMLRQEGFELAFSVQRGLNDLRVADPLSLKRINIGQRTTTQILHAQLMAGWYKTRA